jgi:hypothetical protein
MMNVFPFRFLLDDGILKIDVENKKNMAAAKSVVYRKQSKKDLFSNEILSSEDGIECRGQTEVKNALELCKEAKPERVYEINMHASKLTKIENFEKFTKLRCLDLSCNQIKTVKGLEKNMELKELKLYSNKIKTVQGLNKLKELCSLQLQDNSILKIGDGIQNLKKLKSLRVDCNEILTISVSEIAACSKLAYLNICNNKVTDISFINCLPNLEEFYASHNNVTKIPDLGRCKKLQELDLSYNSISSIAGIKNLPSLTIARLEHNMVKDFDGTVKTLEQLYVANNKIVTVEKLPSQFPSIEVLDISSNRLDNLKALCQDLSECSMLRELNISDNSCFNPASLDHQICTKALPRLEVLNSNLIRRPQSSCGRNRPPMRPVSATQMVSAKHLEEQVSAAIHEQNSFESMISSKFDIVYDLLERLPEKTGEKSVESSEPKVKGSFLYAGSSAGSRPGTQDSQKSLDSPRSLSESSRPSSRCSNRARIHDARTFAEQHFDQ